MRVISSPIFRKGLPASKAARGISLGLNSTRPEGTLSLMLSHLTLRMAGTHEAICNPTTFTSVYQRTGISYVCDTGRFGFIPSLAKGESRSQMLKIFGLFPMKTYGTRLKIFAHNLQGTSKKDSGKRPRDVMKILVCCNEKQYNNRTFTCSGLI